MTLDVQSVFCGAQDLGLALSDVQCEQLVAFGRLLLRWNKVYNLTRIDSEDAVLRLHILDSLSFVAAVADKHPATLLDVGSGGGLPAIPLAVMRPDIEITMVDSVQKKTVFLQQVIMSLDLKNAHVLHCRIEDLPDEKFDAVTCRAFATLSKTVFLTRRLLKKNGEWLLMKGKHPFDEIKELDSDIRVVENCKCVIPNTDLERCLIVLRADKPKLSCAKG